MSRGNPGHGRITRLPIGEPWPPHDDTGDLEAATDRPFWCALGAQLTERV
jgi:hypothetical protein